MSKTDSKEAASGQDVLSPGSGFSKSGGGSSSGDNSQVPALTSSMYATMGADMFGTMGIATMLTNSVFESKLNAIQKKVSASTKEQRQKLEVVLTYYFSAHGTSPETQWATYAKPLVFEGRQYPIADIVKLIGEGSLKQFMARFSGHVTGLYEHSADFRSALAERSARLGLDTSEGIFVVDFYGKDASLDQASMGMKSSVRNRALNHRAKNAEGVSTQVRSEAYRERNEAPPVVPVGLRGSFREPAR